MNERIFNSFIKLMKDKFDIENEKHGNSWKTVEIYKLRRFLKEHTNKWFDNIIANKETELLDLLDIANYCLMLYNRLKSE